VQEQQSGQYLSHAGAAESEKSSRATIEFGTKVIWRVHNVKESTVGESLLGLSIVSAESDA
jgi:hypothetical protein